MVGELFREHRDHLVGQIGARRPRGGLARGIDGAAHRGTLAAAGPAVAILGSGIDVMYPKEHAELARQIIAAGGAIISEYPPGTPT